MRNLLAVIATLALAACGGGGGGGGGTCDPLPLDSNYIEWVGSANGNWVVDSDDDFVRFRYFDGFMEFNGYVYPIYVDAFSDLYEDLDGDGFYSYAGGSVYQVLATNGCEITGAVTDGGFYFNIEQIAPGVIQVSVSTKSAVYARPAAGRPSDVEPGQLMPKFGAAQKPVVLGEAAAIE